MRNSRENAVSHAELVSQHIRNLPGSVAVEVLDVVQFLERKQQAVLVEKPRQPGSACGQIWMASDFDAPMVDGDHKDDG